MALRFLPVALLSLAFAASPLAAASSVAIDGFGFEPSIARAGSALLFQANVTDLGGEGVQEAYLLFGLDPTVRFSYDASVIAYAPLHLPAHDHARLTGTEVLWFGPGGEAPWNATLGRHEMEIEARVHGVALGRLNTTFDVGPRLRDQPNGTALPDLVIRGMVLDLPGLGRDAKLHVQVENLGAADSGPVQIRLEPPQFIVDRLEAFPAVPAHQVVEATYYGGEYQRPRGQTVHAWIDAYDESWEFDESNNSWTGPATIGRSPADTAWEAAAVLFIAAALIGIRKRG